MLNSTTFSTKLGQTQVLHFLTLYKVHFHIKSADCEGLLICFILQIKDSAWREGAIGNTSAIQFKGIDQNKIVLIFIDIFHINNILFERTSSFNCVLKTELCFALWKLLSY